MFNDNLLETEQSDPLQPILFVSAGYWAGEALQHFLGDLKPDRLPISLSVIALVTLAALIRYLRNRPRA